MASLMGVRAMRSGSAAHTLFALTSLHARVGAGVACTHVLHRRARAHTTAATATAVGAHAMASAADVRLAERSACTRGIVPARQQQRRWYAPKVPASMVAQRTKAMKEVQERMEREAKERDAAGGGDGAKKPGKAAGSMPMYVSSLGMIADTYTPELRSPGLRGVWEGVKNSWQNVAHRMRIKPKLKTYGRGALLNEAKDMYVQFNEARARGDMRVVRELATPNLVTSVKSELKKRADKVRAEWSGTISACKLVSLRLVSTGQLPFDFVQATVHIKSQQQLRVYGKKSGKLVGGNEAPVAVDEYWVLERSLNEEDANARWRLFSRIDADVQAQQLKLMEQQQKIMAEQGGGGGGKKK